MQLFVLPPSELSSILDRHSHVRAWLTRMQSYEEFSVTHAVLNKVLAKRKQTQHKNNAMEQKKSKL
jgi:hypothetical protein